MAAKSFDAKLLAKDDIKPYFLFSTFIAKKLKENNPGVLLDVSVRCISNHLVKDLQYRTFYAKILPFLSAKHIRDPISFCKKYKDWCLEDWERVLWNNESTFRWYCRAVGRSV